MTPNDLEAYLVVLERHAVGSAALKLANGTELHVAFTPKFPEMVGTVPEPGGWKSMPHLDDPTALRENLDYKGELPT